MKIYGVSYFLACKILTVEIRRVEMLIQRLGEKQRAKQRSRPVRKPFMQRNDGPVVLQDLLFPKSQ